MSQFRRRQHSVEEVVNVKVVLTMKADSLVEVVIRRSCQVFNVPFLLHLWEIISLPVPYFSTHLSNPTIISSLLSSTALCVPNSMKPSPSSPTLYSVT